MKVLLVNGSPNKNGCTFTALSQVAIELEKQGVETEMFYIGNKAVRDCIGCNGCRRDGKKTERCVFADDGVNEFLEKAAECDGFVFGTPVYYAHPSGRVLSFLDRAFYAGSEIFWGKPGASVVSARRAGTTASFDVLNKYFTISGMPVVSSSYWNNVHGNTPEEVMQDKEGLQIMRNIGKQMAWLLKCIDAGRESGIDLPEREKTISTNFIR